MESSTLDEEDVINIGTARRTRKTRIAEESKREKLRRRNHKEQKNNLIVSKVFTILFSLGTLGILVVMFCFMDHIQDLGNGLLQQL